MAVPTAQEIFETVAKHLFRQGHKSGIMSEDGEFICLYRAPNGDKCAIGVLIPDEVYVSYLERTSIRSLVTATPEDDWYYSADFIKYATEQGWNSYSMRSLLSDLQDVHDGLEDELWTRGDYLKYRLKFVAHSYNLDAAFLGDLSLCVKEGAN